MFSTPVYKLAYGGLLLWLRLCLSTQGVWIQSLVRELKSHILCTKNLKEQWSIALIWYPRERRKKFNYIVTIRRAHRPIHRVSDGESPR